MGLPFYFLLVKGLNSPEPHWLLAAPGSVKSIKLLVLVFRLTVTFVTWPVTPAVNCAVIPNCDRWCDRWRDPCLPNPTETEKRAN